ncbi:ABC-type transporter, permease subunit [Estrella lausannensis]|uniref:ABC-type transporter, permease subunit n=2 Tax=Estrella lausannensis TaxID=483423 RepID=A0A0H5DS17_9BACT|nr:ABC-type transporter, permease subunit [Estrella lausannensis]
MLLPVALFSLYHGDIPWKFVMEGVQRRFAESSSQWNPLLDERIPRLIVLLSTGASLALSGLVMQALFQNPLASPSVLGISCGGSLLVVVVFALDWHLYYPYAVPVGAVIGSFATLMAVYFFSYLKREDIIPNLILTGISISTLLIAIQGVILYALRDHWRLMQTITEWEAGSSVDKTWQHVHMQLPLTVVGLLIAYNYRKELDILSLGDEEALNLGVDVQKVRFRLFVSVALLTGGALAGVGIIAFFGLVLPHLTRRLIGPMNADLVPINIMGGAFALLVMDMLLRYFHIQSLSIGNVSAILGGFFFLALLFGQRRAYA